MSEQKIILHVMVVSFHHKYGPQVEYCNPPLPNSTSSTPIAGEAVELPEEWSYLGFICLPDGAHAAEEEYIYFHLPPVKLWSGQSYQQTLFGLACFRQIDSKDLINRPADVTRTKVQKSVVVLANQCILGSVRSKLGLVTQAYFAQRDFSKVDLIDNLFENLSSTLRMPVSDATLYMGLSLRELVFKFRQKTLQLFKLLLLGKRILFFGHKVERLSAYQYSLISLIPGSNVTIGNSLYVELLRNLHDVGSPMLSNFAVVLPIVKTSTAPLEDKHRSMDNLRSHQIDAHKAKLMKLGHPLRIFGEHAFFQPYIPLQQVDVLESQNTHSFLIGTSNSIFAHHKSCNIDVVANADTGTLEILNPAINQLISLSSADKKFIEDIIKPTVASYSPDNDMSQIQQIDYEGSDDDIRSRFESYVTQLLSSIEYDKNTPSSDANNKKIDYLSEYNSAWIASWIESPSYTIWEKTHNKEYVSMINPGHPNHGTSILDTFAASFSAFSKNAMANSSSKSNDEANSPASSLLQNVTYWYNSKVKATNSASAELPSSKAVATNTVSDELDRIQKMVDETNLSAESKSKSGSYENVKF